MLDMLKQIFGRRIAAKAPRSAFSVSAIGLLFAALFACSSAPVYADQNPGNDSDAITISVLPVFDIGVSIDTSAVNLNFTLPMGATDFTVSPATLTILGNIQPQEIDIEATNISVSPTWAPDADEVAGIDEVQVYALFSVNRSSRPLEAEFAGAKNLITTAAKRAGLALGSGPNNNFENNVMTGGADMDNMLVGTERQMWLRIDTPPLTTTGEVQAIQITVTATRNNP